MFIDQFFRQTANELLTKFVKIYRTGFKQYHLNRFQIKLIFILGTSE